MKLIVCDMDGTLLNGRKELAPTTLSTMKALVEQGYKVGIASGRQYANIRNYFEPIASSLFFVAENGTYIVNEDEELCSVALPYEDVKHIVEIFDLEQAALVICSGKTAHIFTDDPLCVNEIKKYYHEIKVISSLDEIEETVIKIAIIDLRGSEQFAYPKYQHLTHLDVSVSAEHWLDITMLGANKGSAIALLQKRWELTKEDCGAIGDYMNDYAMMKQVGYSIAMENAHPDLAAICRYQTKSNDEFGAEAALQRILHQQPLEKR